MVSFLSGEWILARNDHCNGGSTVFFRAAWIAGWMFIVVIVVISLLDPGPSWWWWSDTLRQELIEKLPWLGAIFAAAYVALYTRFASQWTYLADVYNRIKAAETEDPTSRPMAQWKAGFLEDADSLHLAAKESFASVISDWAKDEAVAREFVEHSGGERRLNGLLARAEAAVAKMKAKHA